MKILYSILILSVLSGCASVVSGGRQNVTVLTPGIEGASCSLTDSAGRVWYVEETPGTALVKRGDGPITVICHKEGHEKGVGQIEEKLAGANYGNLALGPAAPIGYLVDGFSGSAQKYETIVEIDLPQSEEKKPWDE
ncbi:MAG: hypothetical protein COV35_03615 [Alphaproteobacteria bacterium CG11_big_fil_rev_8_21_14_0_20_39_49]|nr:MAG: hypothetical protein COV35_03615 [Alphaproteobacteria bacterium CG11_big_fil_rev_8_21_14_0_20_39_49]